MENAVRIAIVETARSARKDSRTELIPSSRQSVIPVKENKNI